MATDDTIKALKRASRRLHRYRSAAAGPQSSKKGDKGYDRKKLKNQDRREHGKHDERPRGTPR